jgi:hypothetical protein
MWFWLVDLVVLPSKALFSVRFSFTRHGLAAYLCNSKSSPFILPQQLQCAFRRVEVVSGYGLEHGFWQLYMSVLVFVV